MDAQIISTVSLYCFVSQKEKGRKIETRQNSSWKIELTSTLSLVTMVVQIRKRRGNS